MPDQYGFDHLGDEVRCIECPAGGALGCWPEQKRAQHAHTHRQPTTNLRRQRPLLAASPPTGNEEKEDTVATTTKQGASAKQVAIDVLRKAGEPLHAKEIAKRVLASGRSAGLKGKTPEATISAMLAVGSKPGGPFTRVDKGTYALADTSTTASKPTAPKPVTAPPTTARKPAAKPKPAAKHSPGKRTAAKRSR